MVPGHEIAGVVSKAGDKVTKFKVGDRVGVGCFVDSCRTCGDCKGQLDNYCDGLVGTYNSRYPDKSPTYGGYSTSVTVDENYVLRIPDSLPLDAAAPLLCAGITLYSPLRHWGAGPGKQVAVLGLGGLGHMGVKLARAMGAEVTVLSQSHKKKDDAMRLGAHHYYAMSEPENVKKLRNKFDLILNTVSAELDWKSYVNMLKTEGTFVALGIPEKSTVDLKVGPLIWKRRAFAGSMIGSISETQEMLDFCGLCNIVCDIEVIPIQKVNEAYERVLKSDVRYRFVIDMSSLK
jgi:uncharacterized zinc-type alcohol dehydrogenase-like protein